MKLHPYFSLVGAREQACHGSHDSQPRDKQLSCLKLASGKWTGFFCVEFRFALKAFLMLIAALYTFRQYTALASVSIFSSS